MGALSRLATLVLVFAAILGNGVIRSDGLVCGIEEEGIISCRPAVTGSHPTPPSRLCCSTVAHADVKCICKYKESLPAFGVDIKLVLALPRKCKLSMKIRC
ncbi:hypothetical protein ACHQM5_000213 [Ranunculus cassubicifolius]